LSRPEVLVESVAREGRSAYRLVVQVGAGAAALASIVGLLLTLANLWSGDQSTPAVPLRVTIGKPDVHITTFKDYLTEHGRKHDGIPESVLATKVVAVDYRATVAHAPLKTTYPLRLTLQKPRKDGAFTTIAQKQGTRLDTGIDSGTDRTIGDEYFDHLPGAGPYRIRIDVVSGVDPSNVLDFLTADFTYR
jgi:hypothetical protein